MPKTPNSTAAPQPVIDSRSPTEIQRVEQLLVQDRRNLGLFVKDLYAGVTIDNMDDELQSWWRHRY